jgi:hypothetical protein
MYFGAEHQNAGLRFANPACFLHGVPPFFIPFRIQAYIRLSPFASGISLPGSFAVSIHCAMTVSAFSNASLYVDPSAMHPAVPELPL